MSVSKHSRRSTRRSYTLWRAAGRAHERGLDSFFFLLGAPFKRAVVHIL